MRFRLMLWVSIFSLVCEISPVSAQGWGRRWLESLSGPGPFAGVGYDVSPGCWHWLRQDTPKITYRFFEGAWSKKTPEEVALGIRQGGGEVSQAQIQAATNN